MAWSVIQISVNRSGIWKGKSHLLNANDDFLFDVTSQFENSLLSRNDLETGVFVAGSRSSDVFADLEGDLEQKRFVFFSVGSVPSDRRFTKCLQRH